MYKITKQDIEKGVDILTSQQGGCYYIKLTTLKDGTPLYFVMGYSLGYDKDEQLYQDKQYTICGKIAINIDDLQCDYDMDFYELSSDSGDIYDCDTPILRSDHGSQADYFNNCAIDIVDLDNNGKFIRY